MAEKYKLLLSDSSIKPDDGLINELIGSQKELWLTILEYCREKHNAYGDWIFYNDGKRWLFKMQKGKRTLFWAAVAETGIIITFYFGDKAEAEIISGSFDPGTKDQFINGKRFGQVRAVTFDVPALENKDDILGLIDLKVKIK